MRQLVAAEGGLRIGEFEFARTVADWIELVAVVVIGLAVLVAVVGAIATRVQSDAEHTLEAFKRTMARGLLVGLDLLIAADIIKTVTVEPTIENAAVLAILVSIRTLLSWTLVLEIHDRWPWQKRSANQVSGE